MTVSQAAANESLSCSTPVKQQRLGVTISLAITSSDPSAPTALVNWKHSGSPKLKVTFLGQSARSGLLMSLASIPASQHSISLTSVVDIKVLLLFGAKNLSVFLQTPACTVNVFVERQASRNCVTFPSLSNAAWQHLEISNMLTSGASVTLVVLSFWRKYCVAVHDSATPRIPLVELAVTGAVYTKLSGSVMLHAAKRSVSRGWLV